MAPRRYGKSSLVLHAIDEVVTDGVLVAYCDLLRTPTKERFAAALAKTIVDDLDSPRGQVLDRAAALFRGLRLRPVMELDPEDAGIRFSFDATRRQSDIDDTIEKLLELPGRIGAERKRQVVLVFDEFQEVVKLDSTFPNLMRAVFQTQPEVGHVYLGSKRHVLDSIFNDRNEPFWRSARRMDIGPIPEPLFTRFLGDRFAGTGRAIDETAAERLVAVTHGQPYATQELAYFTWELVPGRSRPRHGRRLGARRGAASEHNNLARIWELATRNERLVLLALSAEPLNLYPRRPETVLRCPRHVRATRGSRARARGRRREGRERPVPDRRAVPRRVDRAGTAGRRRRRRAEQPLMRVWVDITNSPHVPFFKPLLALLEERGHDVTVTAREYAQTLELLAQAGIDHEVVGPRHGGAGAAGQGQGHGRPAPRAQTIREGSRLRPRALPRVARAPADRAVARRAVRLRLRLRIRAPPARARLPRGDARDRPRGDTRTTPACPRSDHGQDGPLRRSEGGVLPRSFRAGPPGDRAARARSRPRAGRRADAAGSLRLPPPREPALPRGSRTARCRPGGPGGRAAPYARAARGDPGSRDSRRSSSRATRWTRRASSRKPTSSCRPAGR